MYHKCITHISHIYHRCIRCKIFVIPKITLLEYFIQVLISQKYGLICSGLTKYISNYTFCDKKYLFRQKYGLICSGLTKYISNYTFCDKKYLFCASLWCWQYQRQMGKRLEGPSEFNFMSRNWSLNTVQKQPNSSAINSNLLLNIFPHWETSSKTEWGSLHSTISITN